MKFKARVSMGKGIDGRLPLRAGVLASLVLLMASMFFVGNAQADVVMGTLTLENHSDGLIIVSVGPATHCMDYPYPGKDRQAVRKARSGAKWKLDPGETYTIDFFRRQGHGCDGEQGKFELIVDFRDYEDATFSQYFNFSNNAVLHTTPSTEFESTVEVQADTYHWIIGSPN